VTTLLVANRGEIALRIFRTAERMGMRTVAVYSDADEDAPHVRAADVRKRIGPAPAVDSYLRAERILEAARESGADLIHPGYGFLAEDGGFAKACEDLGFVFVGPPSSVLARVGDKVAVRRIAEEAGVPLLPAYDGEDASDEAFARAAAQIGYPVLCKPAGGGGGKGMAVVASPEDLAGALASARRIALAAFGDDRLLLERYLASPRHVEVQVMADAHGNVIHLGERDCSLQRRHQKLLEETPAPGLDPAVRDRLHSSAVALASRASYVGAGTCEFLVADDGSVGFIEMNARLQVEHPVTELVTGLDLVELQLRVALGESLPIAQEDVAATGHAIEVRVYAEDPEADFLPQAGRVEHVRWPAKTRVDTGIEESSEVTPFYDPLVAKLIVKGSDRADALRAMQHALDATQLLGLRSNLTFLASVVRDPVVVDGAVRTDWLEDAYRDWKPPSSDAAAWIAAGAEADRVLSRRSRDPWSSLGPWRANGARATRVVLRPGAEERTFLVEGTGPFVVDGTHAVGRGPQHHQWWVGEPDGDDAAARGKDRWYVWTAGAAHEIPVGIAPRRLAGTGPAHLGSPLPGQVVAVRVEVGQHVDEGDELVVVEAMKMEHAIKAPSASVVRAVLCVPGDKVDRGQALVDLEPA
jgi:acetyl/propionyl-CoA carboxylase alpha subunit